MKSGGWTVLTDLRPNDQWDHLNREVTNKLLGPEAREEVRVYRGVEAAVWEVTQGAARLFPHRRKVICFAHQDPFHVAAISTFMRDGFEVTALPISELSQPTQLEQQIDLDTLLVLVSLDEPLTGRKFAQGQLAAWCDKKKAFLVQVNHHLHRQVPHPVWSEHGSPYTIEIRAYRQNLAVAHLGSKAKLGSAMSPLLDWLEFDLAPLWLPPKPPTETEQNAVRSFESAVPGGGSALWNSQVGRLGDRAAVYWGDLDGHAVIHFLAQEQGRNLAPAGLETRFETTSLSRWGGLRTMDWLKHQGLTDLQIRGSLIVPASELTPAFTQTLERVIGKVRSLQGF